VVVVVVPNRKYTKTNEIVYLVKYVFIYRKRKRLPSKFSKNVCVKEKW